VRAVEGRVHLAEQLERLRELLRRSRRLALAERVLAEGVAERGLDVDAAEARRPSSARPRTRAGAARAAKAGEGRGPADAVDVEERDPGRARRDARVPVPAARVLQLADEREAGGALRRLHQPRRAPKRDDLLQQRQRAPARAAGATAYEAQ
jgi:hypothetical protein